MSIKLSSKSKAILQLKENMEQIGEKEFIDEIKQLNRYLDNKQRYIIVKVVSKYITPPKGKKLVDILDPTKKEDL